MRKITTMRLDAELLGELTAIAANMGVSRSSLVEDVLAEYAAQPLNRPKRHLMRRSRPEMSDEQIKTEIFE